MLMDNVLKYSLMTFTAIFCILSIYEMRLKPPEHVRHQLKWEATFLYNRCNSGSIAALNMFKPKSIYCYAFNFHNLINICSRWFWPIWILYSWQNIASPQNSIHYAKEGSFLSIACLLFCVFSPSSVSHSHLFADCYSLIIDSLTPSLLNTLSLNYFALYKRANN